MCWVHINAPSCPRTSSKLTNSHLGAPPPTPPTTSSSFFWSPLCHCAHSLGTQIKPRARHTSYMNEHLYGASGVRCGMWGQRVCGPPEATSTADLMGLISMDHLILFLHLLFEDVSVGCAAVSRSQLWSRTQPGIYVIKVAKTRVCLNSDWLTWQHRWCQEQLSSRVFTFCQR